MNDVELRERIASLLRLSRDKAGMSQDAVAKRIGVSKRTVQNWESCMSTPDVREIMQWFDAIDIPIYPYMLRLSSPERANITAGSTDVDVRAAMLRLIQNMDVHSMRKNFFEMFGEHGTAPDGMGEVKTAYLHLPMDVKVGIAEIISTQFEICQAQGRLVQQDHVMPDIDNLKRYISAAKKAVIEGKETYLYGGDKE